MRIFRPYDIDQRRLFGNRGQVHALYNFGHHPLGQLLLLHPATVSTEYAEIVPLIQSALDHHRPALDALSALLYLFLGEYVLELLLDLRAVLSLRSPPEDGLHVILAAPLQQLKSQSYIWLPGLAVETLRVVTSSSSSRRDGVYVPVQDLCLLRLEERVLPRHLEGNLLPRQVRDDTARTNGLPELLLNVLVRHTVHEQLSMRDVELRPALPLPASQLTQMPIGPHLLKRRGLVKKRLHDPFCGRIDRGPFLPPLSVFQAEDLLRVLVVEPKQQHFMKWWQGVNLTWEL